MSRVRLALLVIGVFAGLCDISSAMAETPFQELVGEQRYREAIRLTCQEFSLQCKGTRFVISRDPDPDRGFAETDQVGIVHVNVSAFHHYSSDKPHQGWLAATLGHELIHRRQGSFSRVYAQVERIYGKNSYLLAARELEAWGFMKDNARRFKLTWPMLMAVETSREYFEWIVEHNGTRPPGDGVPGNYPKYARLRAQWVSWQKD